jgi:aminomethyltransferase
MLKRTPLYDKHVEHRGKLVDFAGWELPVEFSGIIAEHKHVRSRAGLFDVSHMGEIEVSGAQAEALVQKLITSDASKLAPGQITYTLMCNQQGGVVDDLLVYKYSDQKFLLVVNAANIDKDMAWIEQHQVPAATVTNLSDRYAQIALQGPLAEAILQPLCPDDLSAIKFYWFLPETKVAGVSALVSRTGYTGEQGFEIYLAPEHAQFVWERILEAGGDDVIPIGLGARDTLRFEAKLPLYGHELSEEITPLEAGLGFFVKFDKGDFIGREALLQQKQAGIPRKLVEFEMVGRGIPRADYPVEADGQSIGKVTTGAFAPSLGKNIGLALVATEYARPGQRIEVIIRNRPVEARVGKGLFYVPTYRRKK